VAGGDFRDFGEVSAVVIGDFETLAGLGAEDAGEMAGVVAGDLGVVVENAVDEEAAAGQETW